MKTIVNLTCPNCKAQLTLEKDREVMFCQYCGAKLLLNDENTFTYRHINEAEVRKVESEKIIRLREIELEEHEFNQKQIDRKKYVKIWLCSLFILFSLGIIGLLSGALPLCVCLLIGLWVALLGFLHLTDSDDKHQKARKRKSLGADAIIITSKLADYYDEPYEVVESLMRQAGFSNIKCVPLKDLNLLHRKESGLTEEVIIDGDDDFDEGEVFSRNSKVVIMYHSPKDSLF